MQRHAFLLVPLALAAFALPAWGDGPETPDLLPPDRPMAEVIDHYVERRLDELKVEPAPPADGPELLRRLTLDLAGRIPTPAELDDYLNASESDRRVRLVDRLLAEPTFARHQAQLFATLFADPEGNRRGRNAGALRDYLRKSFTANRPWDRVFRDLLLPEQAGPDGAGADEFLKGRVRDLDRLTADVSGLFFGVNISCAQCHDHPHVRDWTQDHFYGMKSFLARTFDNGGFLAERGSGAVKYIPNKGQEKVAPVMFLTGKTLDAAAFREPTKEEKQKEQRLLDEAKKAKKSPPPPAVSLRAKLVETALEPGQRHFFSRAVANRVWYNLFGYGLVMPLDQMHSENPASHPELLAWLARDLESHDYDLRRVVRGIVLSDAYARASRWEGKETPGDDLFAVARLRALTPTQMAVALKLATADPEKLPTDPAGLQKKLESLEQSAGGLASLFENPGERFEVSVGEAMLFANNADLQKQLLAGPDTLVARMQKAAGPRERAELAVRTVLSRPARDDEVQTLADYLQRRADRPEEASRQVVWALLTGAEFRFNH